MHGQQNGVRGGRAKVPRPDSEGFQVWSKTRWAPYREKATGTTAKSSFSWTITKVSEAVDGA